MNNFDKILELAQDFVDSEYNKEIDEDDKKHNAVVSLYASDGYCPTGEIQLYIGPGGLKLVFCRYDGEEFVPHHTFDLTVEDRQDSEIRAGEV